VVAQRSFSFPETNDRPRPFWIGIRHGEHAEIIVVTGAAGLFGDAAIRLLDRALAESGLGQHDPRVVAALRCPESQPPDVAVALGPQVGSRLLRRPVSLALERGRLRPLPEGGRVLLTEHPSAILRLSDPLARGREYRRLVNDLMMAVPCRRLAA
jgi:hypothetical protein